MKGYMAKRVINMFLVFVGIVVFMFFLYLTLPGNYFSTRLDLSLAEKQKLEHLLHYDQPKVIQFRYWISGVLRGDLGQSISMGGPVGRIIFPSFWNTFSMFSLSLICAVLLSIPIATISAVKPYTFTDNFWTIFALIGISIPPFVLGALLTKLFTYNMTAFTLPIFQKISFDGYARLMNQHILPFIVITFANIAVFMKYLRSSMIDVLSQEYIKTARAKGLKEKKVFYKHGLKNAMIPVVTIFSTSFPNMISSVLMVELVFGYPGLGMLMINSVHNRDYPLIMGYTIVLAIIILIMNFLLDITYCFLDPRIRLNK